VDQAHQRPAGHPVVEDFVGQRLPAGRVVGQGRQHLLEQRHRQAGRGQFLGFAPQPAQPLSPFGQLLPGQPVQQGPVLPAPGQLPAVPNRFLRFLAAQQPPQPRQLVPPRRNRAYQENLRRRSQRQRPRQSSGEVVAQLQHFGGQSIASPIFSIPRYSGGWHGTNLVHLVQAEHEILHRVPGRDLGQHLLRLKVGIFLNALYPDGIEHMAEHRPGDGQVRSVMAVDVRQIEQDLPAQRIGIVRDDSEPPRHLAVEQLPQCRFLRLMGIRDGSFSPRPMRGDRGDRPADQSVDQRALAHFLAADQADQVKALLAIALGWPDDLLGKDRRIVLQQCRPVGAGQFEGLAHELFDGRGHGQLHYRLVAGPTRQSVV
jgi:hypothetical protein